VLRPFTLHRPGTAEEACAVLGRFGDDAVPYAGGTELLLLMKLGLVRPLHLVDVKSITGFSGIAEAPRPDIAGRPPPPSGATGARSLTIAAAVTHRAVERSALVKSRCPLVASVARHVANVRVRNVGTVGGNLAFADPHSDLATLFLALDATMDLVSPRGRRTLPLAEFVRGPWETARQPDELLASVQLAPWPAPTAAAYVKFGIHERPTLAIATALLLDGGGDDERPSDSLTPPPRTRIDKRTRVVGARVAVGCVDPRPARLPAVESRLVGVEVAALESVIDGAATVAAETVDPADDLHGSADYKRAMVAVFVRRALRVTVARARGVEPPTGFPHAIVA
jgi:aerobic carbon-monoxide dehydrogenase medium subunit